MLTVRTNRAEACNIAKAPVVFLSIVRRISICFLGGKMIVAVRSANIQQGVAIAEVFEWAVKVSMYLNEKFGTDTRVLRNVNGTMYQVHWATNYETLAQMEETNQELIADEGYNGLLAEAREQQLFVAASIVDNFHQSVP